MGYLLHSGITIIRFLDYLLSAKQHDSIMEWYRYDLVKCFFSPSTIRICHKNLLTNHSDYSGMHMKREYLESFTMKCVYIYNTVTITVLYHGCNEMGYSNNYNIPRLR